MIFLWLGFSRGKSQKVTQRREYVEPEGALRVASISALACFTPSFSQTVLRFDVQLWNRVFILLFLFL